MNTPTTTARDTEQLEMTPHRLDARKRKSIKRALRLSRSMRRSRSKSAHGLGRRRYR